MREIVTLSRCSDLNGLVEQPLLIIQPTRQQNLLREMIHVSVDPLHYTYVYTDMTLIRF